MVLANTDLHLWFVQLSGWPVFLVTVAVTMLFMLALSVGMTRIANRSIAQNMLLAVAALAAVGFGFLGLLALLSRM